MIWIFFILLIALQIKESIDWRSECDALDKRLSLLEEIIEMKSSKNEIIG